MIEIAQFRASQNNLDIDFHLDSCTELKSLPDEQFDMIVSNYVLMDLLDLEGAIRAFNRVLKPSGVAILVFSHPCFPQGSPTTVNEDGTVFYGWASSYFERTQRNEQPWNHFTSRDA